MFFMFTPTWGDDPIWLFFKRVESTNQFCLGWIWICVKYCLGTPASLWGNILQETLVDIYIYILRSCSTLDIQTPGEDRCFNPQTSSEKAFRGSKHLLTRYLEDFGCLGVDKEHRQYPQVSTKRILFPLEELNGLISTLTCILRAGTRFVSENPLLAFPKLLTPLACNMEPKNNPIEKENHLSILRFLSSTLIFQGVPFA